MSRIFKGDEALLALLPILDSDQWVDPGSWGRDGWDLGEWPYVKYKWVDVPATACFPAAYGYLSYCEGDYTVIAFATREERDRQLDESALFHWKHSERMRHLLLKPLRVVREGKPIEDLTVDDLPARMRGHFSWARLNREKPPSTPDAATPKA